MTTKNCYNHLCYFAYLRNLSKWKGVRVVEGNGLENRRAGNGTVGSNPTPSAK